jgi:hypothetical protein
LPILDAWYFGLNNSFYILAVFSLEVNELGVAGFFIDIIFLRYL